MAAEHLLEELWFQISLLNQWQGAGLTGLRASTTIQLFEEDFAGLPTTVLRPFAAKAASTTPLLVATCVLRRLPRTSTRLMEPRYEDIRWEEATEEDTEEDDTAAAELRPLSRPISLLEPA